MIDNIKNLKNTNFYYFYKIIIDNYLKLLFFLIIGLIAGYLLNKYAERQLVISKKISPIHLTSNFFGEVYSPNNIFMDFIRVNKEKISEELYDEIFEFNSDINLFIEPIKLYGGKIQSNITYSEFLKLSEGFHYLKERIDYDFDIYHVSKKISFVITDDNLEERKKKLKNDFNNYLFITNQIVRKELFKVLFEKPVFFRNVLKSLNSKLVLIDNEYLMNQLYKKNSMEIEKITDEMGALISEMKAIKDLIDPKNKNTIPDDNIEIDKEKYKNLEGEKDIFEIDTYKYYYKGKEIYTYDEMNYFAGLELDRFFTEYFQFAVNGIDRDFEVKIIQKDIYFYLIICSIISMGSLVSLIIVRDFIKILQKT